MAFDERRSLAGHTEHIRALVDSWPPLTPEQRDRLVVLLRPAPDGGGRT
jgi:hypothetical protein